MAINIFEKSPVWDKIFFNSKYKLFKEIKQNFLPCIDYERFEFHEFCITVLWDTVVGAIWSWSCVILNAKICMNQILEKYNQWFWRLNATLCWIQMAKCRDWVMTTIFIIQFSVRKENSSTHSRTFGPGGRGDYLTSPSYFWSYFRTILFRVKIMPTILFNTLPPMFLDPPTALLTAVHGWRQKGWMEMGDWKCQSSNKLQCANALLYYYIFVWLDCRLELLSLFYCTIVLYDDATEIQNPDLLHTLFKAWIVIFTTTARRKYVAYKLKKQLCQ